ncbi:MAG: hypothetical protein ACYC61_17175 [Isosphaeraceae bacterium]
MSSVIERGVRTKDRADTSANTDVPEISDASEIESLLEAWYRERGCRIESSLMLVRLRRLLSRITRRGQITERDMREARLALRAAALLEDGQAAMA